MAEEHSFETHRKTEGYLKAKEALLDKMAKWGGLVRKMPGAEDDPAKRRAQLQQQARELASKRADFEVKIEPGPFDQVVRVERDAHRLVATPVSEAERVEYLRQIENTDAEPPEVTDDDLPW